MPARKDTPGKLKAGLRTALTVLALSGGAIAATGAQFATPAYAQDYRDDPRYLEMLSMAQENADVDAMASLGYFLLDRGEAREAVRWFKAAAQNRHVGAMYTLGQAYQNGLGGLKQDDKKAFRWFQDAAQAGDADAGLLIAKMYMSGTGVSQSYVSAAAILKENSKALHAPSMYEMALLYDQGNGVPKSTDQAIKILARAALEGGLPNAMVYMAKKYALGDEKFDTDPMEAYKWGYLSLFFKPSKSLREEAKEYITKAAESLSPEQQISARKAADKWMEKYHAYQLKKQAKVEQVQLYAFQ